MTEPENNAEESPEGGSDETAPDAASSGNGGEKKRLIPRGLGMLFFAEMWERFSFYGMRGLLTLYLVNVVFTDIGNADEVAAHTYGAYGALVYATPFIGGALADRLLGYKRSVMLGAVLMALGHLAMVIENQFFLYVALAFLIAGNGFFKPNISSMVGGLYGENDPRRDAGFTIFYMGINLGAFLQFIPGFLGERVGWWLGFGLAGIGMLVGLIVFYFGQHVLKENGDPPSMERLQKKILGPITNEYLVYILAFVSVAGFAVLIQVHSILDVVLPLFTLTGFGIVLAGAFKAGKVARERLFVVIILTAFNIIFWAFFEQAGSSISLFTDRNVDRMFFGTLMASSSFQSVNPLMILTLAVPSSLGFYWLAKKGIDPPLSVKFGIALGLLGLGFLVMLWGTALAVPGETTLAGSDVPTAAVLVPMWVLILGYALHTVGELFLSPIGLSMITKLSPKHMVSMVMGLWFLSTSMSHHVAGYIAAATGSGGLSKATMPAGANALRVGTLAGDLVDNPDGKGLIVETADNLGPALLASYDQLSRYADVFGPIGWFAIGSGVVLVLLTPILKKWQHGIN